MEKIKCKVREFFNYGHCHIKNMSKYCRETKYKVTIYHNLTLKKDLDNYKAGHKFSAGFYVKEENRIDLYEDSDSFKVTRHYLDVSDVLSLMS